MRVLPGGWPDLHGFGGIGEGIRGGGDEHDEHDEHTKGNRGKSIQTHTHTPSGYSRGPESPTQIQSNHKKRHKGRILMERSNSKPIGRMKRLKRPRLLELQGKRVALGRVQQNSKTRQLGEVSTLDQSQRGLEEP